MKIAQKFVIVYLTILLFIFLAGCASPGTPGEVAALKALKAIESEEGPAPVLLEILETHPDVDPEYIEALRSLQKLNK